MMWTETKEQHTVKGVSFEITARHLYDEELKTYVDDEECSEYNLKEIRNGYRKAMNLLRDDEIKKIRGKYHLSQKDFSLLLGFGEITITRYETKQIQDSGNDWIIRSAARPMEFLRIMDHNKESFIREYSLDRYMEVRSRIASEMCSSYGEECYQQMMIPEEYIGYTAFTSKSFYSIVHEIIRCLGPLSKDSLSEILYRSDVSYYRETGKTLTGLAYRTFYHSPAPLFYDEILNDENITVSSGEEENGKIMIEQCAVGRTLSENELKAIHSACRRETVLSMDTKKKNGYYSF